LVRTARLAAIRPDGAEPHLRGDSRRIPLHTWRRPRRESASRAGRPEDYPVASATALTHKLDKIPKRIIQCGKAPADQQPLACQASAVNARLLNPDYEYCFFDDAAIADFVKREFPEYLDAFARFPFPIQRVDFFRYLAVYRLGGFYLDLDVFLTKGLSPLTDHACVFPFEELTLSRHLRGCYDFDWEVGNYAFGAVPEHPFLKAVIGNCIRSLEQPAWALEMYRNIPAPFRGQFVVTNTTGPGLVTRTLAENRDLQGSVTVLFPHDVCEPRNWHHFGNFGAHLMAASWRHADGVVRRRLARMWESRTRRRFMTDSRARGARRDGGWLISLPQ
jgi:mannosyltransferase OCH1-like enzyme